MKKRIIFSLFLLASLLAAGSAGAEPWHEYNEVLAHAVPNECYAGYGVDYPGGITPGDGYTTPVECPDGSCAKTNDTYIWALTEEGDSLWFASAANVACTTIGSFMSEEAYNILMGGGESYTTVDTDTQALISVCEFSKSQVAREGQKAGAIGDWRPSKVFRYIKDSGELINLTGQIYDAGHGDVFDDLLGIRCAGSYNGVVFFAGGNQSYAGVSMFAFDDEGGYLGYHTFTNARQARKMIVSRRGLYVGMAGTQGAGLILRWGGNPSDPFSWQTVGRVSGSVTELAEYIDNNGRTRIVAHAAGGLYVSPPMWLGRLSWWQAWSWRNVWSPSDYEPDQMTVRTYGPGGVAQLGEWVYWGTMHIPLHAAYANLWRYGGIDAIEAILNDPETYDNISYGTFRATTTWRARNLGQSGQEIELVYGETHLGAWDDTEGKFVPVETGWTPLNMPVGLVHPYFGTPFGSSGFGNPNNNYSWTALPYSDETGDHLFFGTMDQTGTGNISNLKDANYAFPQTDGRGADLWRFSINSTIGGSATTAVPEFTNGAGNIFHYGVRCMIGSDDGNRIYLGMAGNAHLMHPYSDLPGDEPRDWFHGGWELRELGR